MQGPQAPPAARTPADDPAPTQSRGTQSPPPVGPGLALVRRELWLALLSAVLEVKLHDELGDMPSTRAGVDLVLVALSRVEAALPALVVTPVEDVQ